MSHQPKDDKKPIGKLIQEKRGLSNLSDTRIRISNDYTFYGVTKTKAGDAETSLALKIILESGEQLIVQYHEMVSPLRYDGATTIQISTPTISIKIEGKNLDDIIDYLAEHRLVWIKEPDSDFTQVKVGDVEIEKIEVKER